MREIERARENMLVIIAIYVKRKDLVRWRSAFINIYLAVKSLSSFPLTEKEKRKEIEKILMCRHNDKYKIQDALK